MGLSKNAVLQAFKDVANLSVVGDKLAYIMLSRIVEYDVKKGRFNGYQTLTIKINSYNSGLFLKPTPGETV